MCLSPSPHTIKTMLVYNTFLKCILISLSSCHFKYILLIPLSVVYSLPQGQWTDSKYKTVWQKWKKSLKNRTIQLDVKGSLIFKMKLFLENVTLATTHWTHPPIFCMHYQRGNGTRVFGLVQCIN